MNQYTDVMQVQTTAAPDAYPARDTSGYYSQQTGGVARYEMNTTPDDVAETYSPPQQPLSQVHAVSNAKYADERGPAGDSVVMTARNAHGGPLAPSQMTGDSIVTVNGMEMTAHVAERLGLIRLGPAGGYEDAAGTQQKPSAPAQQSQQPSPQAEARAATPSVPSIGEAEDKIIADYAGNVAEGDLVAALGNVLEHGEISAGTLERIASQRGEEPEQTAQALAQVRAGFERQAGAAVEQASGLPAALVFSLTARHTLTEAARAQAMRGDMSGYASIAEKAVATFIDEAAAGRRPTTIGAHPQSDLSVRRQGRQLIVNIPGTGEVELKSALRAGLVVLEGG